ncbi:uncharacterized protein LOC135076777 [Ostrinia nubilalis]|uniref:uncharacterized protein LOC135076777 n=1 Tax=Ostrinia nubilalis TaxID=29057 RepID=UPI00308243E4
MIYTGVKELLSEQFLIDCSPFKNGCGDASLLKSYSHIVTQLGGILRDNDYYPYENGQNNCRWSRPEHNFVNVLPVPVIGFRRVNSDEDLMAEWLYRYGPVTAGINSASMARYKGGIDEPQEEYCDPETPNHSVLIVGYNEYVPQNPKEPRVKYWIIKNSWGKEFGDKGYYYLVRGRNACGIANDVSLPFVQ